MTRHIQPPHLPEQRDLLDCIIVMILFIILLYVLPLEAAEVSPIEHYIPDGAVIAVRDGGVLVILSEGER